MIRQRKGASLADKDGEETRQAGAATRSAHLSVPGAVSVDRQSSECGQAAGNGAGQAGLWRPWPLDFILTTAGRH